MRLPPPTHPPAAACAGRRTRFRLWPAAAAAAALLLGACAQPPAVPAAASTSMPASSATALGPAPSQGGIPAGIVSITYADPAKMSDARTSPRESAKARRAWLDALCLYLADRAAPLLAPGQLLDVRLADVQRAGRAGPPRIDLEFTLRTDSGRVLRQGRRQLGDAPPAPEPAPARPAAADPLGAEKALLDAWLRREFPSRAG